jgi:hypothetical protein
MATNVTRVSKSSSGNRSPADSPALAADPLLHRMPLIQRKVLAQLAAMATDARGYGTIQLAGYSVAELDEAVEALHNAGLLNAFFVNGAVRPRFHPSSLTREGRRIYEQYLRSAGA